MCEFISWIEKEKEVAFLTTRDIKSKHGKETLEKCLNNDFIGHGAIREFYKIKKGVNKENRDFWNGNIPQEIKNAWNSGKLDGMLKYLQEDDLMYIINNAPEDFKLWTLKNKFKDLESMSKDSDWNIRLAGLSARQDYEAMSKDSDWNIRLAGLSARQDYEAMSKDSDRNIRLAGLSARQDYEAMSRPVIN